jgi:hypothetical protein
MATGGSTTEIQARVTNAIAGIQKNLSTVVSIPLAGVATSPATLLSLLQAYAPLVAALAAAHTQLSAAVLAEHAQRTKVLSALSALFAYATSLYGSDPEKLGDFGFTPKKPRVESAATRAEAAAKAKATRAAKKAALAAVKAPAASAPPVTGTGTGKGTGKGKGKGKGKR